MADWKIHRKDESCLRCERPFEEGEAHFSVLRYSEQGLSRDDLCRSCFPASDDEGEVAEGLGEQLIWWRTRRRLEAKRGLAVDFEAVEALFLTLGSRKEEPLRELRFLLSLLLMRKRRLKLLRVKRTPEAELMIVRRPRRVKEQHEVQVFELTAERAGELRGQLEGLFEGEGIDDVLARGVPAAGEAPAAPEGGEIPPAETPVGEPSPPDSPA